VNATDHQNVSWKEWPARITASTEVPNDPPTCCMIRVTLLASGTDARGHPGPDPWCSCVRRRFP
jgi:hypothetical protein